MQLSPSLAEFMDKLERGPRGLTDALAALDRCASATSSTLDLQQMSLTDADLAQLLPRLSAVSPHVTELNLFMNELTELPAGLSALGGLRELHAGCNPLRADGVRAGLLRGLPRLEMLDVGFSESLAVLPDDFAAVAASLRVLHAGNGRLRAVPPSLCACERLEDLQLYGNDLRELPDAIGRLRSLRTLNVGRNQIESVPASIGECANLTTLHLYENSLRALPQSVANLDKLVTLNVASNAALPVPPREVRCAPGVKATARFYASLPAN